METLKKLVTTIEGAKPQMTNAWTETSSLGTKKIEETIKDLREEFRLLKEESSLTIEENEAKIQELTKSSDAFKKKWMDNHE